MTMTSEDTERAISYLVGQTHGLQLVMQLLAATHHNPKEVLSRLQTAEQKGLGQIEGLVVLDAAVDGFRAAIDAARRALEGAPGN